MLKRYIGDRAFYKTVLALAVPIMIQNAITNFVSMLDNIMVGSVGTNAISGVGIANQIMLIYIALIFGVGAGASIFGAQFFGKKDIEGIRYSFRFKILLSIIITAIMIVVLFFFGKPIINLYLGSEENSKEDVAEILKISKDYINIMLIGLVPFAFSQSYAGTLRECNRTVIPMVASLSAVGVNLVFNYLLIFGHFGFPRLGTNGAAIATVISRFTELGILVVASRVTARKNEFIIGVWKSLKIPAKLLAEMLKKTYPLILNELMWSGSLAVLSQCYSTRGIDAVAANNITGTYFNLFTVSFAAVGVSMGLILGQKIGKGEPKEEIKATFRKLMTFVIAISIVMAGILFVCAYVIPSFYDVSSSVKVLAKNLLQVSVLILPLEAMMQGLYYTMRSGGKTFLIFIYDAVFMTAINVPLALIIANFTDMSIVWMYGLCQGIVVLKCIIGFVFVKSDSWIKNVVSDVK